MRNNTDLFDDQCPDSGHWKRFEDRLDRFNKQNRKNKQKSFFFRTSIAASFILLIGLASFYYHQNASSLPEQQNVSDQFVVTNDFFQEQMNDQISQIECKLINVDESVRKQVTADLENVIHENSVFIENIEKDVNAELAMMYLVKHYRSNIEALQQINSKLGSFVQC